MSDCYVTLDPVRKEMLVRHSSGVQYHVGADLKTVWWRQGTFDRNLTSAGAPLEKQLQKSQWGAFMRSMMVFDEVHWINHPAATYHAETKAVQLREAARAGFSVPATIMTNDLHCNVPGRIGEHVAFKSLDTVLLNEGKHQHFGYTTLLPWQEIAIEELRLAPASVQAILSGKLDLRVTILGRKLWCVSIKKVGQGIEGDWRLTAKAELEIDSFQLPDSVAAACHRLLHRLNLTFGAIDLALTDDGYWFIEINPTGEWGWLDKPDRPIAKRIANELAGNR